MKKFGLFGLVLLVPLLIMGASVWEGAGAVSLNGELPDEGYYVATKSFPRNTVVDVTNLETGQTIRVIVAASMDSPGLLAVLSRDAAGAIGLHSRSIGRIRMSMPSDPVAFSRFTDEVNSSGDPDFDPMARIAAADAAGISPKQYGDPRSEALSRENSAADTQGKPPEKPGAEAKKNVPEKEKSIPPNPAAQDLIVDLPGNESPPAGKDSAASGEKYGYTPAPNVVEGYLPATPAAPPAAATPPPPPPAPKKEAAVQQTPPRREPASEKPAVEIQPPVQAPAQAALVPAEQRPPLSSPAGLPNDAEIAPLSENPANFYDESDSINEDLIIPSLDSYYSGNPVQEATAYPAYPAEPVLEPVIPSIGPRKAGPETVSAPDPESPVPRATVKPPAQTAGPVPHATTAPPDAALPPGSSAGRDLAFTVPRISKLERGKYYLQLGAYSLPELVENELSKISTVYPLVVQEEGRGGKQIYRILIGPVNPGESGALLQRFKGSGYRDAFIRKEG
ncbi:MAG: SPOR domain-containing protein [Treponema sp.]|jgi:hypothetical protein|nr:SPOR domain-containing protein [Treponema sp.]